MRFSGGSLGFAGKCAARGRTTVGRAVSIVFTLEVLETRGAVGAALGAAGAELDASGAGATLGTTGALLEALGTAVAVVLDLGCASCLRL